MPKLTRCVTYAAATMLVASAAPAFAINTGAASAAPSGGSGGTRVPLISLARTCDFKVFDFGPNAVPGATGFASVSAVIHVAGAGQVIAQVHLVNTNAPDTHYDVGLIQAPRASSSTCGPGDPGTAFGSLDTDAAGLATTTLQGGIQSGTTGVWLTVQRPNPHAQDPAEWYTSTFIVPV